MKFVFMTRKIRRHTRNSPKYQRDPDVYQCKICRNFHSIRFCRRFLNMDARKRNIIVQKYNYCTNCLAKSHDMRACPSLDTCRICGEWHHTLLHPGIRSRLSRKRSRSITQVSRQKIRATTTRQPSVEQTSASPNRPGRQQRGTASSNSSTKTRNSSSGNNTKILFEAIRSLAEVLCTQAE